MESKKWISYPLSSLKLIAYVNHKDNKKNRKLTRAVLTKKEAFVT